MRDVGCVCVRRMIDPPSTKVLFETFLLWLLPLWSGVLDVLEVLFFLCHQVKMALGKQLIIQYISNYYIYFFPVFKNIKYLILASENVLALSSQSN